MEIKNKFLINVISRIRNNISSNRNVVRIHNIHCANNEIRIIGEKSYLLFEGKESYIRSGKIMMKGNNNCITVNENTILSDGCSIRITGNNNVVSFGSNCHITNTSVYIFGNNNRIVLEGGVTSVLTYFHIEDDFNSIVVGKGTTLHGRNNNLIELALDEGTEIKIGGDCMISNGVSFRSSDSHSVLNNAGKRINPAGDIKIGDHVWVGMRSLILKNTSIDKNCVVGAGSICNKKYGKEACLIAGNPAKVVKENINWSRDRL